MTSGTVKADESKCLRCGGCVAVCPQSALRLTEHGISCDREKCNSCKICIEFCPVEALRLKGEKLEGEKEVRSDQE